MSISREDDKHIEEEVADIERGASPTFGFGRAKRRRILHQVPVQVRANKRHIYDPLFVSLGPYHHGKPQFHQFECFKDEIVSIMLDSEKSRFFHSEMLERVEEIRSFYGGISEVEYDDEALAIMMLRDTCLVLYFMEITVGDKERLNHAIQSIGPFVFSLTSGDCLRLENQIPWWVIRLLIALTFVDEDEGDALIRKFFSYVTFWDYNSLKRVPWEAGTEKEPLHLLEAFRTTCLKEDTGTNDAVRGRHALCPNLLRQFWRRTKRSQGRTSKPMIKHPLRSVMELKAKGIYVKPSSDFLNDIEFSSYSLYGVLRLPVLVVDSRTVAFFSNVIVLEMSSGSTSTTGFAVTSYVNLMKSLIESPKDVKELQENGILYNYLEDNEQIVRVFKEIDTFGQDNMYIFEDIKRRVNEHCNSKAKTWIADLINTYFRTPWTVIALFATTFLLWLTFLQTYYTMNPRNTGH